MAQIFHPSANTVVKLSIIGTILAIGVLGAAGYSANIAYGYKYYIPIEQPVQFSHRHHVGDDGIDCRYCHNTVETSAFAGMPSTKTCMTCHSQIWSDSPELQPVKASFISGQPIQWNRVHDMPDFVYFNHSIHIKKGVGCETCHGRVDEKPLMFKSKTMTMSWCLNCHRNPEKFIRPREHVFEMGWKPGQTRPSLPPSMAIIPTKVSPEVEAAFRASGGHVEGEDAHPGTSPNAANSEVPNKSNAELETQAGHGGAVEPKAGEEATESGHNPLGQGEAVESQMEMGLRLKKEYKIRTERELTDCGTCHR